MNAEHHLLIVGQLLDCSVMLYIKTRKYAEIYETGLVIHSSACLLQK